MLGLKGRQDIAGGEAPCKENKKNTSPEGVAEISLVPKLQLGNAPVPEAPALFCFRE
ncbi:MAG: hypothetical protein HW390_2940 [Candidatus Brocadiaceae bacterium]|nr:hypothetical protein [Candidatus Brocadiaceae bacterium]